jgi:acid phosphatase
MTKRMGMCALVCVLAVAPVATLAQQAMPLFAPTAQGERIRNLDALKTKLRAYHDCKCPCGCYEADLDAQADRAIAFLRERVAHQRSNERLAMVLDIDETTLSNYEEMVKADFGYNSKAFEAWVKEAKAPAIPATLRLYKEAKRLGVAVFFLTGRNDEEQAATEANLRTQGFDTWKKVILRNPQEAKWGTEEYKSYERKNTIKAKGYTIVLNVGDQWSDLRGAPEAEYSVKYPDPYYFIP